MHKIDIPASILERAKLMNGGRDHLFDSLDMSRTAHVIVDLQNGFVVEGAPVEVPYTRDMLGEVNAISRAVREAGGTNAFLRFTNDPDEKLKWTSMHKMMSAEGMERNKSAFSRGAPMWELHPELDVAKQDLIFDKTRFSGFIPGTCDMHEALQARGIDTLIITGTLTNCCCESSARDAMQMGYNIIFVSDANAALTDAEHNATLSSMAALFDDVMSTAEVLKLIGKSTPATLSLAS
ncbi:MAG: isochorismatase [Pelagibacterium sp. SCN 63-23]|nr:MAG: isochorismatase [Pelagibacterium sp. SCN 63-23]